MSAGVAERPLVGCDLSITRCIGSSGAGLGRPLLAQTVALELQAMGVVDDRVEDGVGEGRLADQVVPAVDRDLRGAPPDRKFLLQTQTVLRHRQSLRQDRKKFPGRHPPSTSVVPHFKLRRYLHLASIDDTP